MNLSAQLDAWRRYLEKAEDLRGVYESERLFITQGRPHEDSIARWIKGALKEAEIEARAHSTRRVMASEACMVLWDEFGQGNGKGELEERRDVSKVLPEATFERSN